MTSMSYGDLAMSFRTQLNNARLRAELSKLSQEMASGKTSDLSRATGGDLGSYAGIENSINALGAYQTSAAEAANFVDTLQRSLGTVQDIVSEAGPALLLAGSTAEATLVQTSAADARTKFASVVSVLNTKVADRALLSGTEIGSDALADSETMLADLQTAIAAETTAAGVEAVVTAWFDDAGGGFETMGYLGGDTDLAPFRLGPDERGQVALRADDQNIRDVLKGLAMAALVADGALSGLHEERVALTQTAATHVIAGDHALSALRAEVGTVEAQIEGARTRNSAEISALEMARNEIISVDPYDTATELQAVEFQLETLYTITARLSRLRLTDYL
jgi:flagellar hook-associated protein 3 FlgL